MTRLSPDAVLAGVSLAFHVPIDVMRSLHRGGRSTSRARFAAYDLLAVECKQGIKPAGTTINKDHSSVCYGRRKCRKLLEVDSAFREAHERAVRHAWACQAARNYAGYLVEDPAASASTPKPTPPNHRHKSGEPFEVMQMRVAVERGTELMRKAFTEAAE
jgi:hypothetical protein